MVVRKCNITSHMPPMSATKCIYVGTRPVQLELSLNRKLLLAWGYFLWSHWSFLLLFSGLDRPITKHGSTLRRLHGGGHRLGDERTGSENELNPLSLVLGLVCYISLSLPPSLRQSRTQAKSNKRTSIYFVPRNLFFTLFRNEFHKLAHAGFIVNINHSFSHFFFFTSKYIWGHLQ